jgi:hypothetical protein
MRFFYYLLYPFTIVFNGTANAITGALGVAPASEGNDTHSEQEIRQLIAQGTDRGIFERDEESRLAGVFNLEDTPAREIMVPRPDVVAIPEHLKLRDVISVVAAGHYTRYPVHEEHSPDRVWAPSTSRTSCAPSGLRATSGPTSPPGTSREDHHRPREPLHREHPRRLPAPGDPDGRRHRRVGLF